MQGRDIFINVISINKNNQFKSKVMQGHYFLPFFLSFLFFFIVAERRKARIWKRNYFIERIVRKGSCSTTSCASYVHTTNLYTHTYKPSSPLNHHIDCYIWIAYSIQYGYYGEFRKFYKVSAVTNSDISNWIGTIKDNINWNRLKNRNQK